MVEQKAPVDDTVIEARVMKMLTELDLSFEQPAQKAPLDGAEQFEK